MGRYRSNFSSALSLIQPLPKINSVELILKKILSVNLKSWKKNLSLKLLIFIKFLFFLQSQKLKGNFLMNTKINHAQSFGRTKFYLVTQARKGFLWCLFQRVVKLLSRINMWNICVLLGELKEFIYGDKLNFASIDSREFLIFSSNLIYIAELLKQERNYMNF